MTRCPWKIQMTITCQGSSSAPWGAWTCRSTSDAPCRRRAPWSCRGWTTDGSPCPEHRSLYNYTYTQIHHLEVFLLEIRPQLLHNLRARNLKLQSLKRIRKYKSFDQVQVKVLKIQRKYLFSFLGANDLGQVSRDVQWLLQASKLLGLRHGVNSKSGKNFSWARETIGALTSDGYGMKWR